MKKLPIGKQHLEQFIQQDLIYVDKTELIYRLVDEGNYYFLARPRRFGKSLLVDTLREIFLGKQHLFKGLWIYDKLEWKEYPVIHLDFSVLAYHAKGLDQAISDELKLIAENYGESLSGANCKDLLRDLITKLSKKEPVAFLIDEYDKPITDHILDLSKADINREILREFYGVLKPLGDKLRIVFITGIAKFARVSLFSVLNNIIDITTNPDYATICGITPQELQYYFDGYLKKAVQQLQQPKKELLAQIKKMYDGYSWDGEQFVYNPFSLLNFLYERRFKNYWFKTGTPSFLIELLRQKRMTGQELEGLEVDDNFFDTFVIEQGVAITPLLFQTGYLTVKKIRFQGTRIFYTLGYPNEEVRRAFIRNLIEVYTFQDQTVVNTVTIELEKAFYKKDILEIRAQLNILLADLSYHLFPLQKKDPNKEREKQEFIAWEGYFQTIIYIVLQYIGVYIDCEVTKHKGRLDAVVEVDKYIYIMEFKLGDAAVALKQIKDQQYAASYQNSSKEVLLLGIAFDQLNRTVKPIEWEVFASNKKT